MITFRRSGFFYIVGVIIILYGCAGYPTSVAAPPEAILSPELENYTTFTVGAESAVITQANQSVTLARNEEAELSNKLNATLFGDSDTQALVASRDDGSTLAVIYTHNGVFALETGRISLVPFDNKNHDKPELMNASAAVIRRINGTGVCAVSEEEVVVPEPFLASDAEDIGQDPAGQIDLLVAYTDAALEWCSDESLLKSIISLAVDEANLVMRNSKVPIVYSLAGCVRVPSVSGDGATMRATLKQLQQKGDGHFDTVFAEREKYKADQVVLVTIVPSDTGVYGIANLRGPGEGDYSEMAFCVVQANKLLGQFTLVHELAHNLGCNHDKDNAVKPALTSYSYGYRFATHNAYWRDVMAYQANGELRVPMFSNPDVNFQGQPVGSDNANNARVLREAAEFAANFRRRVISD